MAAMIEVEQLVRHFGPVRAVDGLTFTVDEGEVFGLLGPNGAGKTTTVRLLNGVLTPSAGKARVLGLDPVTQGCALRRQTGILTETPSLYERLTARDNLMTFGALYDMSEPELSHRVDEMLDFFQLSGRADDRVGEYSKGMKQRLALARALLHEPPLLFLDEPTAGLDPEAARHVTQMIEQLSHQKGRTVVLCTHNLSEAQRLCDRVAMMDQGRMPALGTLAELARTVWRGLWVDVEFKVPLAGAVVDELRAVRGVSDVQLDAARMAVRVDGDDVIPAVVTRLAGHGAQIMRVNPRQPSLEDIYFELRDQRKEDRR
jgi:ABC-2 type transport system ATP-binding protein